MGIGNIDQTERKRQVFSALENFVVEEINLCFLCVSQQQQTKEKEKGYNSLKNLRISSFN